MSQSAEHLRAPQEGYVDGIAVTAATATTAAAFSASIPGDDPSGWWRAKWTADDSAGLAWLIVGDASVATPTAANAYPLLHGEEISFELTRSLAYHRILGGASDGDLTLVFDG